MNALQKCCLPKLSEQESGRRGVWKFPLRSPSEDWEWLAFCTTLFLQIKEKDMPVFAQHGEV